MRRTFAGLLIALTALVGAALPAEAATGSQTFVIFGEGSEPALLVAGGLVSGVGLDFESEETETSVFELAGGTIAIDHPADGGEFDFNPITCVGRDRFTGTYTLTGGTGAYAGISGSGTYRGWAIFVATRLADGSCSEEDPPVLSSFFVRASGTTTLP